MPEVPQNMQNDLQRMEFEARGAEQRRDTTTPGAFQQPGAGPAQNYGADESNS